MKSIVALILTLLFIFVVNTKSYAQEKMPALKGPYNISFGYTGIGKIEIYSVDKKGNQ